MKNSVPLELYTLTSPCCPALLLLNPWLQASLPPETSFFQLHILPLPPRLTLLPIITFVDRRGGWALSFWAIWTLPLVISLPHQCSLWRPVWPVCLPRGRRCTPLNGEEEGRQTLRHPPLPLLWKPSMQRPFSRSPASKCISFFYFLGKHIIWNTPLLIAFSSSQTVESLDQVKTKTVPKFFSYPQIRDNNRRIGYDKSCVLRYCNFQNVHMTKNARKLFF